MSKESYLGSLVTGIFVLSCFIYFQFLCSDQLFQKEHVVSLMDLPEMLSMELDKPAWLACFLGLLFSSLLLPVGAGALMITVVLLLEWLVIMLVLRRFRVGVMAPIYALFPVMLEWGTYCSPHYHLYSILSFVITLCIFYGYSFIKNKWLSMLTSFILLFPIYSLVGSRLFVFAILILLYDAEIGMKRWGYWTLLLLASTVLPEYLKDWYSLTEEQAYQYPYLWLPGFFPAIMLTFGLFIVQLKNVRYMQPGTFSVFTTSGLLLMVLISAVLSHSE